MVTSMESLRGELSKLSRSPGREAKGGRWWGAVSENMCRATRKRASMKSLWEELNPQPGPPSGCTGSAERHLAQGTRRRFQWRAVTLP